MPQIMQFQTSNVLACWQGFVHTVEIGEAVFFSLGTRSGFQCVLTRLGVGEFQLQTSVWLDDEDTTVAQFFTGPPAITATIQFASTSATNGIALINTFEPPTAPVPIVGTIALSTGGLYGSGGSLANGGVGTTLNISFGTGSAGVYSINFPVGGKALANAAALIAFINTSLSTTGVPFGNFATASDTGGVLVLTMGNPPAASSMALGVGTANTLLGLTPVTNTAVLNPADPPGLFNLLVTQCTDFVNQIEGNP